MYTIILKRNRRSLGLAYLHYAYDTGNGVTVTQDLSAYIHYTQTIEIINIDSISNRTFIHRLFFVISMTILIDYMSICNLIHHLRSLILQPIIWITIYKLLFIIRKC